MKYQQCCNCVMDTSDPQITFDENGICDHCNSYKKNVLPNWHDDEIGEKFLTKQIQKIKKSGINKQFDSIIGLSGGLDSSYLLHTVVTKFNLKPLVFHVDGGWNTSLAVNNIQMLVEKLGLELYTEVINWEEMKDLQLAFFKSGLPHLDLPQDHAFVATQYHFANKYNIKYILNGANFSTECVRNPLELFYYGTDMKHINFIRKKFGAKDMPTYPFSSIIRHKIWLRYLKKIKVFKLLDHINYNQKIALNELKDKYGWKPYPRKHFESRFTRYYEGYWLPTRFGFDTRRVQYSSLILTNQLSRESAIEKLKHPEFTEKEALEESKYVANKLKIPYEELIQYRDMPKKYFYDYPNSNSLFEFGANFLQNIGLEAGIKR